MYNVVVSHKPRVINVDFELHTCGDLEFKNELIHLLIDNVKELQEAAFRAVQQGSQALYAKVTHKVAVAIDLLNDDELRTQISNIRQAFEEKRPETLAMSTTHLSNLCIDIISGLKGELTE